ncbi:MAG: hypothetical protein FWE29_04960 [Defluviitaleaceae bacterium]|nr:hypothetical protein [Defluviitaleaceae bacterium]
MKKEDLNKTKEVVSVLNGQPLRSLDRAGSLITANFGDLVECELACYDESGKLVRDENGEVICKKIMSGKLALDITCSMRLSCGDKILLAKSDVFLPNSQLVKNSKMESKEIFDWDSFNWAIRGNNYFDEMIAKYIGTEPFEFIVDKVKVSELGDLSIYFKNGFVLESFIDGSGDSENWCFYETSCEDFGLVVFGDGIEKLTCNNDKV